MTSSNQNFCIILSAPSGGGKSSITDALIKNDAKLLKSISVTTRPPRPRDTEAVNYFFRTIAEFEKLITDQELLEYAKIYDNLYGTPKKYVLDKLQENFDIIFDIDYQGMCQIKANLAAKSLSIFLMPPSLAILRSRIEARGQDDETAINYRMKMAEQEILNSKYYDHIIVNDDFATTVKAIQEIINRERNSLNLL